MLKPREYQVEAYKWALSKKKAVVCMPTGTGKTLVAALWINKLMQTGKARKILVLEPTRFMVEQTSRFLRSQGIEASPLHGSLPSSLKERALKSKVIVATPEILLGEYGRILDTIEAVVVDECHHTTGKDAYLIVMNKLNTQYSLGLSAFIPRSRHRFIEKYIGEIRCWSWSDPRISKFIPEWYGEIYEAELNSRERELYNLIEHLWETSHGSNRALLGNALRWLARDGALSLWETLEKPNSRLRKLLGEYKDLIYSPSIRPAHKAEALIRILTDYEGEYSKAIIFVERIVIAHYINELLSDYRPVMILGRRRVDPYQAIRRAKEPSTRIIISTSAGEEGIDLPEADLLIIWSNIASPLRFIQRLGRILRPVKKGKKTKYAVFIATPETVDVDSLIDGLLLAEKAGIKLGIDMETMKYLIELSRKRKIIELVEKEPMPADIIAKFLNSPLDRIRTHLKWLERHGLVAYIYTPYGKIYFTEKTLGKLLEKYHDYIKPSKDIQATITIYSTRGKYTLRGSYSHIISRALKIMEKDSITRIQASVQVPIIDRKRGLPYMIRMINVGYSFQITDRSMLEIIVGNIFSSDRWGVNQI